MSADDPPLSVPCPVCGLLLRSAHKLQGHQPRSSLRGRVASHAKRHHPDLGPRDRSLLADQALAAALEITAAPAS